MERFEKTVYSWNLFIILTKSSILDNWVNPEWASVFNLNDSVLEA